MTDFSGTTIFGLVRRLAAVGRSVPSIYVLICKPSEMEVVQENLKAEIAVQFGSDLLCMDGSNMPADEIFSPMTRNREPRIILLRMPNWERRLIDSIDRNIVLLAEAGTVLMLTSLDLAERILAAAPNLSSRLSDVLVIGPDQPPRGTSPNEH
jgi:hypothetical protein